MLQWTASGCAGNSGQTSRTRSQRVITWSKCCRRTRRGASVRAGQMSMPRSLASPGPRWGAAAWGGCRRCGRRPCRPTGPRASASAICDRALLPVHRNSTRAGRLTSVGVGGGRRLEPQARVQGADRWRDSSRAEPGEVDAVVGVAAVGRAPPRRHQPGVAQLAAGGTRRGSAARPRGRSAPAPSGRCGPAPPAAASGAGVRRAAGTPEGSGRAGRQPSGSVYRSRLIDQARLLEFTDPELVHRGGGPRGIRHPGRSGGLEP